MWVVNNYNFIKVSKIKNHISPNPQLIIIICLVSNSFFYHLHLCIYEIFRVKEKHLKQSMNMLSYDLEKMQLPINYPNSKHH